MKRSIRFAPAMLALLLAAGANAQSAPGVTGGPGSHGLPNIDRALGAPAAPAAPTRAAAAVAPNGFVASTDSQRGVPTFFWADPSISGSPPGLATAGAEQRALAFVTQNAKLYGLSPAALQAAYLREVHDTGRGGVLVTFGQRVDGVDVHQTEMNVLLDRSGGLVAIGGNLHGAAAPLARGAKQAFSSGPAQAIAQAATDAFRAPVRASDLIDLKQEKAGYRSFGLSKAPATKGKKLTFATPARAKKVFYPMPSRLVPAYYLEVDAGREAGQTSDLYGYVIAAESGQILMRRYLVSDATYKYRVWSDATAPFTPLAGPQADFAPHPTGVPDGSLPPFIAPILVSMDGFNTNPDGASDPWLGPAATDTNGNNVDAYADLADPDGFTPGVDLRATPTASFELDRTYDVTLTPDASQNQIMASATQLFFVTNWLHDYFYDSGFDEAAGNAQALNFGRGGIEGDSMKAEAQDVSGTNNANMSTPADGERPRMQMYLWDGIETSLLSVQPINLSPAHQTASFGPGTFSVTAGLALADDGTGPSPNDACQPITNDVSGKIALVDRGGGCSSESKVKRAQQAGAVGVLMANNTNNGLPAMADDGATNGVTIGSFGIALPTGNALKQSLSAGTALTVTMSKAGAVLRDGSIDNDVVAHEWGHYLHHRLVTCGTEQCGGQSEGWGDFNALLMKVREGDDVATGTFGLSTYSVAAGTDAGYFGIRRFPYTRDTNKNGLTFQHVANEAFLPDGPMQESVPENWEVHNAGEVWASMLFQAYTALLQSGGHPFAEAKRRMADYMVMGMKLAPLNPTFTEQRDALLAAAAAADASDFALLVKGFADRGAGTCAVSPARGSSDGSGVVEDFEVSGRQELVSATLDDSIAACDGDGILDGGETGKLHIVVRNGGSVPLSGTKATVMTATSGVTFPEGNTVALPSIAPFETGAADIVVALDGSFKAITKAQLTVTLDNPAACNPSLAEPVGIRVHMDDLPNDATIESADSDKAPWVKWGAPAYEDLAAGIWQHDEQANGNFRFYAEDFPTHSDTALVSPDLVVGGANLVVTFAHAHDFEVSPQEPGDPDTLWDGGLIEISSDGAMSWQDVSVFANPGYNGVIANVPDAGNPLADRPAYIQQNQAWPNTNKVTLDFGAAFANKTVKLRFRLGTDAAEGVPDFLGWYVDDIAVQGIINKPFRTVKADAAKCNLPPVAKAGADLVVDEGTNVALDASASSDAENDPLSFVWIQTAGPNVMLSGAGSTKAGFTAPDVSVDTSLTFQVTVSDATHSAMDSVNVLVKNVAGGPGGSADGGGGAGGDGTGGRDIVVTACTCTTAGSHPSGGGALLAPLLGALAFLTRRERRRSIGARWS